ncbi:MAG: glycosyltransferase family 4 protein [Candidatus Diapherotrites archaeon]|nr:glycosyltransferase family 4 protein [Candidatus Diapherotrites archaeon]
MMAPIQILMLGWEFPPFKSGGLGTYLFGFTKELNKLGAKIIFIMPYTGKKMDYDFIKIVQADGIDMLGISSSLTPYAMPSEWLGGRRGLVKSVYGWGFFEEVAYYNARAVQIGSMIKCDVIHCHDWMTMPAGIALKRILGKPLIVTIHSTEYDRTGNLFPNARIMAIERAGLLEADVVITVSNYEKRQLVERYGIPSEKIKVVYNAIDPERYRRTEVEKYINDKIVLFVGRLTIQKGCEFFLEAAKKVLESIPNVRFVIVGSGDQMHALIQKSIDLGIADRTHFVGFDPDVTKYYSIADVFVMPSVSEPFGLTPLEALACDVPVIISKQSGVSEVLRNCLKVDFWDTHELANKIIALLNYKPLHDELREKAKREITRFRTWRDVAEECMQIYKAVI